MAVPALGARAGQSRATRRGLARAAAWAICPRMSRPLIAFLIGTVGFIAYVAVITALADPLVGAHWLIQAVAYTVAGLAWVFPAVRLMRWGAGR